MNHAEKLLRLWMKKLGFGHYKLIVREMPPEFRGDYFATVRVNIEEECLSFDMPNERSVSKEEILYLVVHEMAHALFAFAASSSHAEEAACNRLARLLTGHDFHLAEAATSRDDWYRSTISPAKRYPEAQELLDSLPSKEAEILHRLIWERASLSEVADEMHVSKRSVGRMRDKALRRLRLLHFRLTVKE